MVIGTFLSALVMFVSAKMVTLTDVLPKDYIAELNTFLLNIAIFGVVACVAVIIIFCLARKWRKMPHFVTLCLGISQVNPHLFAFPNSEDAFFLCNYSFHGFFAVGRVRWSDHVVNGRLSSRVEALPAVFRVLLGSLFFTNLDSHSFLESRVDENTANS